MVPQLNMALELIKDHGLLASSLLLMIEEVGVPLPFPGDLVIAFVGYQVALGRYTFMEAFLSFFLVVLGSSSVLYFLASKYGEFLVLKVFKLIHVSPETLEKIEHAFRKHGSWVMISGRFFYWFRVPLTIFAGMSEMKYSWFITRVAISTAVWLVACLGLGMYLGPQTIRFFKHSPIEYLPILGIVLLAFIVFFISRRNKQAKKS
ncbi:MAG: DedA family protein [Patescibacteria group bacterium]|jgi:membrane protein DedA with SNARE-associated domain